MDTIIPFWSCRPRLESEMKFEDIEQALDWLEAQKPAKILKVLKNYPGERNHPSRCVLANFCKETADIKVWITLNFVEGLNGGGLAYELGPKLLDCRRGFDHSRYPQLESK